MNEQATTIRTRLHIVGILVRHGTLSLAMCLAVISAYWLVKLIFQTDSLTPTDLPPAAKAGFEQLRREAIRERAAVGGIRVLHSPLLERSFPNHCIVRVDFTFRYSGNALVRPISVYAIPLHGGELHRIRDNYSDAETRVTDFLRDARFTVKNSTEAEALRRILWELLPPAIGTVGVEARDDAGRKWRLGGTRGYTVLVEANGIIDRIKWGRDE